MMSEILLSRHLRLYAALGTLGCVVAASDVFAATQSTSSHPSHAVHHRNPKKHSSDKKAVPPAKKHQKTAAHHDAHKAHSAPVVHHSAVHRKHAVAAAGAGAVAAAGAAAAVQKAESPSAAAPPVPDVPQTPEAPKGTVTGLPLPRYASLRADEVNMRAGPGRRFPILWVYHRRSMPLRIEREFDVWRLVEDESGQKGWVQQAVVSGSRSFVVPGEPPGDESPIPDKVDKNGNKIPVSGHMDSRVTGSVTDLAEAKKIKQAVFLKKSPEESSAVVAVLRPGTVGSVKECAAGSDWCKVSVRPYSGWVLRRDMWGIDAGEVITPS